MMTWEILDSASKLDEAVSLSYTQDIVLFKHSTTCSISHMAKMRVEEKWDGEMGIRPYYLDLKSFKDISAEIAERFSVTHESLQILLIRNGGCIYDASHFDITVEELKETLAYHIK